MPEQRPAAPQPPLNPAGLDTAEAQRRLARDGPNLLPHSRPRALAALVVGVLAEPMFLMLLAAGGIYLLLGDPAEALFLLAFVLVVIAITLVQARRTQRALDALRELSAPRALVWRDGRCQRIASAQVVRGDLLQLQEGDRIAADARVIEGEVEVDESLLSGESLPVPRHAGDAVSASTVLTRGHARAEVTATGAQTAVGRIGRALALTREPPTALQRQSRQLVRLLGLVALLLALAQVLLAWWWGDRPLLDALLSGIALAMSMLPEEIPVILTVFLALGAWRMSRRQVLTRRVATIEALGAVTVLAVDKTGTLTQNRMAVAEVATPQVRLRVDGAAALPEPFHRLVDGARLATPEQPFDPMERAILDFARQHLPASVQQSHGARALRDYPVSARLLAMTRVYAALPAADQGHAHHLATKGAPEAIADLCHLDAAAHAAMREQVESMAADGRRVLAVAVGRWSPADAATPWPAHQHEFDFEFLGLIGLADPPRPEVPAALAQCREAGVRVIMMTGDHPGTARAIAQQVGLAAKPRVITGAEIDALDDAALAQRLRTVDACARLRPEHKLRLVQGLRASGQTVAMTGDGVNDAPALKAADVGIAMGARGTDVAREAASLVLLDDSFAHITEAMRQGRHIYRNIAKATRFVFAVHVPIVALALLPTLLLWPAALMPLHIVLLELLIDPACSIVFEAEPEDADLMRQPPRAPTASLFAWSHFVLPAAQGLGLALMLLALQAGAQAAGLAAAAVRAVVFAALLLGVVALIAANRDPARALWHGLSARNPWMRPMAVSVLLLLALCLGWPVLGRPLALQWPGAGGLLAALATAALCLLWLEWLRRLTRRHPTA